MKTQKECLEASNSRREELKKEFISFLEEKIIQSLNHGCYEYRPPFIENKGIVYWLPIQNLEYEKFRFITKNITEQFYKEYFEDLGFKVLKDGTISWKEENKDSITEKIKKFICKFCQ